MDIISRFGGVSDRKYCNLFLYAIRIIPVGSWWLEASEGALRCKGKEADCLVRETVYKKLALRRLNW